MKDTPIELDVTPAITTLLTRLVNRVTYTELHGEPLPSQADSEARILTALCAAASSSCAQSNMQQFNRFTEAWIRSYAKGITT